MYRTAEKSWVQGDGFGNHRIIVKSAAAKYARCSVLWRRRDLEPEKVGVRITFTATGEEIFNAAIIQAARENGVILFEAPYDGEYAIYIMPYVVKGPVWYFPDVQYYRTEQMSPCAEWVSGIETADITDTELTAIDSRTDFDSFYPMEIPMTVSETKAFKAANMSDGFALIIEDRSHPVIMLRELPLIWSERKDITSLHDTVHCNEYYVFQVAVYAETAIGILNITYSLKDGSAVPQGSVTCFNKNITDWLGREYEKELSVSAGEVKPLWFGIDMELFGSNDNLAVNINGRIVILHLDIDPVSLPDKGDEDPTKLTRMRWLNSKIGLDSEAAEGYPDVELIDNTVACLGRKVSFNEFGLPSSIKTYFSDDNREITRSAREVLKSPVSFDLNGRTFIPDTQCFSKKGGGRAEITSGAACTEADITVKTAMEYDGFIDIVVTITPRCDFKSNAVLCIPVTKEASEYMVGLGREGGRTPKYWKYTWDVMRTNNTCWLGSVNAGLHIKPKHTPDVWEVYDYTKQGLPRLWHNDGKGDVTVRDKGDCTLFSAQSGEFCFTEGVPETLRISLIVTPLKLINYEAHYNNRYYHADNIEDAAKCGAKVMNLHQGENLNEYINYPFTREAELKNQIDRAHELGLKYKLYYTVREQSNHTYEFWALRSFGDEIMRVGGEYHISDPFLRNANMTGGAWMCEHLVEGFVPAWQSLLKDAEYDCAFAMTGLSRWHNYYIMGLDWLGRKLGTDGLYLDGIGYDREIMKRVRKTLDRSREGALIDLHSGYSYAPEYGMTSPICMYTELFPSVDSLWLGEMYEYDCKDYDWWLVESSGIPFGLMGEMLHGGGNPWRGMIFGMSTRYYGGIIPKPMWDFWDKTDIKNTRMYGYWDKNIPVGCSRDDVKITVYTRDDLTLICAASWSGKNENAYFMYDSGLGVTSGSKLYAPYIEGIQEEKTFNAHDFIDFPMCRGWLFILQK
ncbi:MAG: glycoside hydrolase domain-containing protein [Eubacteriales bacterium]